MVVDLRLPDGDLLFDLLSKFLLQCHGVVLLRQLRRDQRFLGM
jgi:hypothetical protein